MGKLKARPKLDIVFKKMFVDKENIDMLQSFISCILGISQESIKDIKVQNTDIIPDDITGKFSRLDLKLIADNKQLNIEMQISNENDYAERTLYYWAKMYSEGIKSGEEYNNLKETICINIVAFKMFECKEYYSLFKLQENTRHNILTDKCQIHFFELPKLPKELDKKENLELWLHLLNAETEEELTMIKELDVPIMNKAINVIYEMTADEKMYEMIRMREKTLHDEASALGNARRQGIAEGIEKGLQVMINLCQKFNQSKSEVIEQVMQEYNLSEKQAEEKVNLYWK